MIVVGDCRETMRAMAADSVDAIVTDPPYGLSFMGKEWDHGVPGVPFWAEALRVAKPGSYLLAFGGTRTFHRLTCSIEDAGWEIRDCLSWLYGSGFPKSRDIAKDMDKGLRPVIGTQEAPGHATANVEQGAQSRTHTTFPKYSADPVTDLARQWQGWGTALKPAWEPIILARKPIAGTVASNVTKYGTGALNVDACRIGYANDADERESKDKNRHADFVSGEVVGYHGWDSRAKGGNYDPPGRWPANVVLDEEAARALDEQSGTLTTNPGTRRTTSRGGMFGLSTDEGTVLSAGDSGGASRFFYCAKASRAEREAGLAGTNLNGPLRAANVHPTVKPLSLMRWLVRLITPPNGLVLDPFAGSGTTGCAAALEGFRFLGCELSEDYAAIARARIAHHGQHGVQGTFDLESWSAAP